jgi:hypothetical protein
MRYFASVLVVAFTLALAGCSDSSPTLGSLTGTVTDAQGSPIAGAYVNLAYTVTWDGQILTEPPSSPAPAPGSLGEDGWLGIWVRDHQNRLVWSRGESDPAWWPVVDLNGDPVPDGPYRFIFAKYQGGVATLVTDAWDILARHTLSQRSLVAQATTDETGSFTIPYGDLPIGESHPYVIVDKAEVAHTADAVYGNTVEVYAFRGDGTTDHGQASVTVDSQYKSVHVDLVIP